MKGQMLQKQNATLGEYAGGTQPAMSKNYSQHSAWGTGDLTQALPHKSTYSSPEHVPLLLEKVKSFLTKRFCYTIGHSHAKI